MFNLFYFDKDAAPMLREAGYEPLFFTHDVVRIETQEQPYWFYHVCYYLDLLSYEIDCSK